MLFLASDTPRDWVERIRPGLDEVLIDHTHCELKAASTAIGLAFRFQDDATMARALSELAREELEHFERMLSVLAQRGLGFTRQRPSPYAADLHRACRPGDPVDVLLVCALIEARSAERMKCLVDGLEDAELSALYRGLLASEARHFRTYLDFAERLAAPEAVRSRLEVLARHEAEVVGKGGAFRLHG